MKSASIVYEFPSISQTFVRAQVEALLASGWEVRIFADGAGQRVSDGSREATRLQERVTYFGVPLHGLRERAGSWRLSRLPAGGSQAVEARQRPRPPGMIGRFVRSAVAGTRLRLEARAFRGHGRFDVIHAHFGPNGVRAVRLRERGVIAGPILTSFYGYDVGRPRARVSYDQLFAHGDRFVALSEEMRDRLISIGCPPQQVMIHRLGVELDRFRPVSRKGHRGLEVLSVARLVPKKGIEHALRAIAEFAARGNSVGYTVVGDGPLRKRLERRARELGVEALVRFVGARPANEIPRFLAKADVLLAPSITAGDGDAEGTPVAILEAEAAGLPVISTRHAGIPEIVDDGHSGFLVGEGDWRAIADRLQELGENESLRRGMGLAGRAIVEARHDSVVLNRELTRIYEDLASAGSVSVVAATPASLSHAADDKRASSR